MKGVRDLFVDILQSALWDSPLTIRALREDILPVIKLAKVQSVLGLIANKILSEDSLAALLNDAERKNLKHFVISNFSTSQMLNNALIAVVQELRKYNINPVLLKGQGIAKYYPVSELRQCGDIDIYVGQENFAKACEVIGEMSTPEDHERDIPSLKHFHTRIGMACFEIHRYTDVYYPKRLDRIYQKISDEGMKSDFVSLDFSGVQVSTPSVDFNAFFIFNHFWHHFIADGVGLRQICDWALLLHHNHGKINITYLEDVLHKMGLMKQWKVFGYIAVHILGLPEEELPFYDKKYLKLSKKVLDLVMLEGNFGKENLKGYKRPKGYIAGKLYSLRHRVYRNLRVLTLFPKEAFRHIFRVYTHGVAVVLEDKFRK